MCFCTLYGTASFINLAIGKKYRDIKKVYIPLKSINYSFSELSNAKKI